MTSSSLAPLIDSNNLKQCTKCHEWKPREAFSKSATGKNGLHSQCNACQREYRAANAERIAERAREYRAANAERIAERAREYYAANAEHLREYQNKYRAENVELVREYFAAYAEQRRKYDREYRAANAERIAEQKREYLRSPAGKLANKTNSLRRRARKLGLAATLADVDWLAALAHFGGCCAACGRPPGLWHTLAADHWIPLSKGGATTPDNIVPLCHGVGGCNNSKYDRDAAEWLMVTFGKRKGRAIRQRIETYLDSRKPVNSQRAEC